MADALEVRADVRHFRAIWWLPGVVGMLGVAVTAAQFLAGEFAVAFMFVVAAANVGASVKMRRDVADPPVLYRLDADGIWAADGRFFNWVPFPSERRMSWVDLRVVITTYAGHHVEFYSVDGSRLAARIGWTVLTVNEFLTECRRRAQRVNPVIDWPSDGV